MPADPLRGAWLARRVQPAWIRIYARLGSTNRTALDLLGAGALEPPAILAASRQTDGRGRRTNRWWSDGGSLCVTFVLPGEPALPITQVPLRAGLAVATVVQMHLPRRRVQVKWPNDVLVEGRKIAGVLCLRERGSDIIGIGLNVRTRLADAPPDVRARAASLSAHLPDPPRRDEVLVALWSALCDARRADDWQPRYDLMHALHGRTIRVRDEESAIEGRCVGLDSSGRLLLQTPTGLRKLTSGTVERR